MTAIPTMPALQRVPTGPPRNLTWTVDQFHYLGDLGMFEGRRAMLIEGVIVEEGQMNPPHRLALELAGDAIRQAFGAGWRICIQLPLVLGQTTDPEPDIAVVSGSARGETAHPTTASLVVEVSDSSLRYDLSVKLGLYASAGIADYWVLDVNGRELHVHRDPKPDPSAPFGHSYANVTKLAASASVSPLTAPHANIVVSDMLP
ncbi:MAG: Uma2 family endonuclease [Gemmataceae bacterium]